MAAWLHANQGGSDAINEQIHIIDLDVISSRARRIVRCACPIGGPKLDFIVILVALNSDSIRRPWCRISRIASYIQRLCRPRCCFFNVSYDGIHILTTGYLTQELPATHIQANSCVFDVSALIVQCIELPHRGLSVGRKEGVEILDTRSFLLDTRPKIAKVLPLHRRVSHLARSGLQQAAVPVFSSN